MAAPVDDRYFEWLYGLFGSVRNRNPARSYWKLSRILYTTEFVWLIPNDDNRVEDGKELRVEFMSEQGSDGASQEWLDLGCSVLEMLISLARMAEFDSNTEAIVWFGIFMDNLGLTQFKDSKSFDEEDVSQILEKFVYRTYKSNGEGGLFPLMHPEKDQRKVELWYQLAAYILERPTL